MIRPGSFGLKSRNMILCGLCGRRFGLSGWIFPGRDAGARTLGFALRAARPPVGRAEVRVERAGMKGRNLAVYYGFCVAGCTFYSWSGGGSSSAGGYGALRSFAGALCVLHLAERGGHSGGRISHNQTSDRASDDLNLAYIPSAEQSGPSLREPECHSPPARI